MNLRIAQLLAGVLCFLLAVFLFIQEGRQRYEETEEDAAAWEQERPPEEAPSPVPAPTTAAPTPGAPQLPGVTQQQKIQYKVQFGDTLYSFFLRHLKSVEDVQSIISLLRKEGLFKTLKGGHPFLFVIDKKPDGTEVFQKLTFFSKKKKICIERRPDGRLAFTQAPLKQKRKYITGVIQSGLYADAKKQGSPLSTTNQFVKLLSHNVDFQRSIKPGDRFEILLDVYVDEDFNQEIQGDIVYAAIRLKDGLHDIYRFVDQGGAVQYYDSKAKGTIKALLKTPVPGARISSRYGHRKHPILGYTAMHKGVDFAARTGTPILAAGDGIIERAGRFSTFGNYVKIKHTSEFSTAYAHLSRYAQGIRAGKRVKQGQVIGYVGSTGRTSGAHLHYEVLKRGAQVNPQSLTLPSRQNLSGKALKSFQEQKAKIDKEIGDAKNGV